MPGFVDVSNMSDLEIKRLGQQDEDDNDPAVIAHNRRYNRGRRSAQPVVAYSLDTVWGAAAYANRVNGGYFKHPVYNETGTQVVKPINRDIMKLALTDTSVISEADVGKGQEAREFLGQQLTMRGLKGRLSDFDRSMINVIGRAEFTSADRLDLALVASQIAAYERGQKELAVADRIDHSKGYLADVGVKIRANVEVTKSVYSQKYGVNFVSGITDTNQAVFFSYRERLAVGSKIQVVGTVKAHRPDATQLSRVRVGA